MGGRLWAVRGCDGMAVWWDDGAQEWKPKEDKPMPRTTNAKAVRKAKKAAKRVAKKRPAFKAKAAAR